MSVPYASTATHDERRADLVLRCIELRRMARWLFDHETDDHLGLHLDEGPDEDLGKHGQIAAQLLDFADVLEVVDREGWWSR